MGQRHGVCLFWTRGDKRSRQEQADNVAISLQVFVRITSAEWQVFVFEAKPAHDMQLYLYWQLKMQAPC